MRRPRTYQQVRSSDLGMCACCRPTCGSANAEIIKDITCQALVEASRQQVMIGITADLDYCPQEVLDFFSDMVHDYGYKMTFFMTHKLKVHKEHELALHPFFTDFDHAERNLDRLRRTFPKSVGVRTHRLRTANDWFILYEKKGIRYDSSFFLPDRSILPYYVYGMQTGALMEIPLNFADDLHLLFPRRFPLAAAKRMMNVADKNRQSFVFEWHPIHVFLNTSTLAQYRKAKPFTHKIEKLEKHRHSGEGVRTLFTTFLESLRRKDAHTFTLAEIDARVRRMLSDDQRRMARVRRRHSRKMRSRRGT